MEPPGCAGARLGPVHTEAQGKRKAKVSEQDSTHAYSNDQEEGVHMRCSHRQPSKSAPTSHTPPFGGRGLGQFRELRMPENIEGG